MSGNFLADERASLKDTNAETYHGLVLEADESDMKNQENTAEKDNDWGLVIDSSTEIRDTGTEAAEKSSCCSREADFAFSGVGGSYDATKAKFKITIKGNRL